jgi:hypothetical protein
MQFLLWNIVSALCGALRIFGMEGGFCSFDLSMDWPTSDDFLFRWNKRVTTCGGIVLASSGKSVL